MILDKFVALFREGADDAKHRQSASEAFDATLEGLRQRESDKFEMTNSKLPTVAADLGELSKNKELDDLKLAFRLVGKDETSKQILARGQKAVFGTSPDKKKKFILFNIKFDGSEKEMKRITPEIWRQLVTKNGADWFKNLKTTFVHEFVHYLDWKRINDPQKAFGKKYDPESQKSGYFNDPIETNAYIQQGLSAIEDHLKGVKSWKVAEKIVGKTAQEFVKKVETALPQAVTKNLIGANRKKLAKRAAQMWDEIRGRLNKNG